VAAHMAGRCWWRLATRPAPSHPGRRRLPSGWHLLGATPAQDLQPDMAMHRRLAFYRTVCLVGDAGVGRGVRRQGPPGYPGRFYTSTTRHSVLVLHQPPERAQAEIWFTGYTLTISPARRPSCGTTAGTRRPCRASVTRATGDHQDRHGHRIYYVVFRKGTMRNMGQTV
jgi:hypothetical protein